MNIRIINLKTSFSALSVVTFFLFFSSFSQNLAFALDSSEIDSLNFDLKQEKISRIKSDFLRQNSFYDSKILEYNDKISVVQKDENKSDAQKKLLIGAYERNIDTLKLQQKLLKQETDSLYKSVMSDDEFAKFKNSQSDI